MVLHLHNLCIIAFSLAAVVHVEGQGCEYDGTQYGDGEQLDTACMILQCKQGTWDYTGKIKKKCGECQVYGDPQIQPFSNHFFGYQREGVYIITQNGLTDESLQVTSYFAKQGGRWTGYTAPRTVNYIEPGISINVHLPMFNHVECFRDPVPPNCEIAVIVNLQPVGGLINDEIKLYNATHGQVAVFDDNHVDTDHAEDTTKCVNIIGTKTSGLSLSLCMSDDFFYSFLYIWSLPENVDKLYGTCDTYRSSRVEGGYPYTKQDGTTTSDATSFIESWEIPGHDADVLERYRTPAQFPVVEDTPEWVRLQTHLAEVSRHSTFQTYLGQPSVLQGVLLESAQSFAINQLCPKNEVEEMCNNITQQVCGLVSPYKCKAFKSGCYFDLCIVSNRTQFAQGYKEHMRIESHIFNNKIDDCPGSCKPIKECPSLYVTLRRVQQGNSEAIQRLRELVCSTANGGVSVCC